jgi:hypothetical protein
MARDVSDGHRRLDGGVAKKVQTQLGVLAFSPQQRVMDFVGPSRSCLCVDSFAGMPGSSQHQGCVEEPTRAEQRPALTTATETAVDTPLRREKLSPFQLAQSCR